MFERLKEMYINGVIKEIHLDLAVNKGWITEEQKLEITEG